MQLKFFFDIYDIVMVFQLITISVALVFVFRHLKLEFTRVLRGIFHAVIIFLLGTLLNYVLFELSMNVDFLKGINFPLSWLITIILYITFFSNIPSTNKIIMGATLYVSVVTMMELGHNGAYVVLQYTQLPALETTFYVMEDIFILLFAVLLKKFSLSKYTDIPPISAVLIFINTTVMAAVVFIYTKLNISGIAVSRELYCVVMLAEYILVSTGYMMIWFHCKVRQEKTELEVENRLLETDRTMLMMSEKAMEDMRCLRHDFQNQYMVMRMLIDDGKYDELKNYFDSMNLDSFLNSGAKFFECGNEVLNAIINMEIMKASSKGVDLTAKVNVMEDLNIENSDLCRILVNLIDNAIEAVERNSANDKPVDCKVSKTKDYLYICVRNGLGTMQDKNKALEMVTSKQDVNLHGFGHRIVRKLVNKYQGHIKYTIEDDEFIAEVMLGSQADNEA